MRPVKYQAPVAPARPAVQLPEVVARVVEVLEGDQQPAELPPRIGVVRAARQQVRVAVAGLFPASRGGEEPRVGAKQLVAPAVLGRVAGEHFEGGVAIAVTVQQQGVGDRIAIVRRTLPPEHLEELQGPVDLIGAGEHPGQRVARFPSGIRDRFHDPDPPAAVGVDAQHRDDVVEAAWARPVPVSREVLQLRGRFLDPVRAREHERVHPLRAPVLGVEPAPVRGGFGREAVAPRAGRDAGGALREGRVAMQPGGVDVAPDRLVRVRFAAPEGCDLRDEQVPEHPGRKPRSALHVAGRGAAGGPGRVHGEQDRPGGGGGGENEGMRAQGAHRHLE